MIELRERGDMGTILYDPPEIEYLDGHPHPR
jgi:hypothetical protein